MVDQIIIQLSKTASGEDHIRVLGQSLATEESPLSTVQIVNFEELSPSQKAAITTLTNLFNA